MPAAARGPSCSTPSPARRPRGSVPRPVRDRSVSLVPFLPPWFGWLIMIVHRRSGAGLDRPVGVGAPLHPRGVVEGGILVPHDIEREQGEGPEHARSVRKPDSGNDQGSCTSVEVVSLPWWDDAAQRRTFDLIRRLIEILVPFRQNQRNEVF